MDEWEAWVADLNESGSVVVAEGPKDSAALRAIGITAPIHLLHGRPLFRVIEAVSDSFPKAVLLVDLDREGKWLYGRLRKGLEAHGVRVDTEFREFLQVQRVSHIEGLDTVIGRTQALNL